MNNGTLDKTSVKLAIQNPTPATALTTTITKGKTTGSTSVRVISSIRQGNQLVYTITDTKVEGLHIENVINDGIGFVQDQDITVSAGKYLTVYEINSDTKKVVRYRCIQITSQHIS